MGRGVLQMIRSRVRILMGISISSARALLVTAGVLAAAFALFLSSTAYAAPALVVRSGSDELPQVALTFDDNTNTSRALAVLRALQENRVPATLFLIGSSVRAFPSINQEIVKGLAAGLFEVGDHSWGHPVLTGLSRTGMAAEIGGGTDAFRAATGARTVPLFRPPYGATNSTVAAVAGAQGFRHLVLWSIDPRDWTGRSARSIADHVVSRAHNGAIVVMHLSARHTAEAVPLIAGRLRAKGYELVTVSEMLKGHSLFLDVDAGTEQGAAVARMVRLGFISGYDGNYFGPSDTIRRSQVAKVATLVGGIHTPEVEAIRSPTFADVPPRWDERSRPVPYPFDYVEEAAASGLVVGSVGSDGVAVFRPYEDITRVQFAQILARMARQLKNYSDLPASDPGDAPLGSGFTDVPAHALADVTLVKNLGLMSGVSPRVFGAWAGAKRGQVALAMTRYLDLPPYHAPLMPPEAVRPRQ